MCGDAVDASGSLIPMGVRTSLMMQAFWSISPHSTAVLKTTLSTVSTLLKVLADFGFQRIFQPLHILG